MSTPNPQTIDGYLATQSAEKRAALQKLRQTIQAAAPGAAEGYSYGLPAFLWQGKALAAFAAAAKHCSFFPMSGRIIAAHGELLKRYDTSKGTIRFPIEKPLPASLVRQLVKARMAEIEAKASPQKRPAPSKDDPRTDPAVEVFLRDLKHPLKRQLEVLRRIILDVSPKVREGFKWNSPSFHTTEYFATINVRGKDRLRLILHRGAKVKDNAAAMRITDPAGLLEWLATDRCLITLTGKDIATQRKPLTAILRQWIRQL